MYAALLIIITFPSLSNGHGKFTVLTGTVEAVKISEANEDDSRKEELIYQIKIRSEVVNDSTNTIEFSDSPWLTISADASNKFSSVIHNVSVSAFYSQHPVKVTYNTEGIINGITLGQSLNALE